MKTNELAIKMMRLISIVAVLDEECITDRFDFEWKFIEQFDEYFKKNYPDLYKLFDEEEIDEGTAYLFECPSNRDEINNILLFSDFENSDEDESSEAYIEPGIDNAYDLGTYIFYLFCEWALSQKECLNSIIKEIDESTFGVYLDYLKENIPDDEFPDRTDIESFEELESWKKDLETFANYQKVESEKTEQKEKTSNDSTKIEEIKGYAVVYDKGNDFLIMCCRPNTNELYFDLVSKGFDPTRVVVDFHENLDELMNPILYDNYCGYVANEEVRKLYEGGKLQTLYVTIDLTNKFLYLL